MKILVAGGGSGKGIAVNNKTKKETFMRMKEVQARLGMGAKKFGVGFVFETQERLDEFINEGWEVGGQATAAAATKDGGQSYEGAVSVSPGVWMYQITEASLALELTLKGTKYFKDNKLN